MADLEEVFSELTEEIENKADLEHTHTEKDIRDLDRLRYRGPWLKDSDYQVNDLVVFGGVPYVSMVTAPQGKPGSSEDWEVLILLTDGPRGERGLAGRDGRNGMDGVNGLDGKDGRDGRNGSDGRDGNGFRWRGRWMKDTVYEPYDVVEFYGSSYIAIRRNSTIPILGEQDWDLMAAAGMAGGSGPQGPAGDPGIGFDFLTRVIFGTTPTPAPNGVETVFYAPDAYVSGTLQVFRGSLRMYPTIDVVETDPNTGKFTLAVAPDSNEPLLVGYVKQ